MSTSNHSQKQIKAPPLALPIQDNQTLHHHSTHVTSGPPPPSPPASNSRWFQLLSCDFSCKMVFYHLRRFFTALAYLSVFSGLTLKSNKYSLRGEKLYVVVFNFRRECTTGTHTTDDRQLKNMHHASFHSILGTSFLHFQRRNWHMWH